MPEKPSDFTPITEAARPPYAARSLHGGDAVIHLKGGVQFEEPVVESNIVARHVFSSKAQSIPGIDYAVEYKLADGYAGGDIGDVYEFDNGSVAFTVVDVEGRGVEAAGLAALVKFASRAYASAGMAPEFVVRNLDRLYLENCAFDKVQSFASVFFGHVDRERKTIGYCSAGHDVAFLVRRDEQARMLPPTAPVIGVFEDQEHLFRQRFMELPAGSILLLGTDGITEARNPSGAFFGVERLLNAIELHRGKPVAELVTTIMEEVLAFSGDRAHDDIVILGASFTGGHRSRTG